MSYKRLIELGEQIDGHLNRFGEEEEEPRKRMPGAVRAGLGAAAVGGGVLAAQNRDKLKAGATKVGSAATAAYEKASGKVAAGYGKAAASAGKTADTAREAARTAGFRGMRKTADVMNTAGNAVKRGAAKLPDARDAVKAGGNLLKKGAKRLKKGSMALFSRSEANAMVELAARIEDLRNF